MVILVRISARLGSTRSSGGASSTSFRTEPQKRTGIGVRVEREVAGADSVIVWPRSLYKLW